MAIVKTVPLMSIVKGTVSTHGPCPQMKNHFPLDLQKSLKQKYPEVFKALDHLDRLSRLPTHRQHNQDHFQQLHQNMEIRHLCLTGELEYNNHKG